MIKIPEVRISAVLDGRRPVGRPRLSWEKQVQSLYEERLDLLLTEDAEVAQDMDA